MDGRRGLTYIELLVALGVFTLLILILDRFFFSAISGSRKVELAADVQQNARIAVERLTREIRESTASQVAVGGVPGAMWVVFKSARLPANNSVFCLYARSTTDPAGIYHPDCFTFPGGTIPGPNYSDPPYASPCHPDDLAPCGTYTPIWQRYVGYHTVANGGVTELRRVTGQLDTPDAAIDSSLLTGGDTIAVHIESFDVALSGANFAVTVKAKGTEVSQGSQLPGQEMLLPGTVLVRN